ncbi:MAG TPA: copper resistance CopC family protein [Lacisediminihabitans sp.]|nr:copper resistance CopC family protein [Lacisediminihabitans sp.]HXD62643.1 copper resistance CopC family protein [Lacisediminihabitans sp.]
MKRALAACIALLAACGAVLVVSAPAQAHNYLVQSTPKAGETLTALPEKFSIITNDLLLNIGKGAGFALQVKDADGLYYGDGCITVDGRGISTPAALGAPGKYEVIWQVISTDGHPVSDEFSFTWKPSSTDVVVSTGSKTAPDCHGTLKPNATGESTTAPEPRAAVDDGEASSTVLWIGGAVLAVGVAVGATLLLTGKKKPE